MTKVITVVAFAGVFGLAALTFTKVGRDAGKIEGCQAIVDMLAPPQLQSQCIIYKGELVIEAVSQKTGERTKYNTINGNVVE